ncbi:hypothetical protein [Gorillibacterium sp. sgz500922]|uniref:hypothetical protein n=1 Tax=Gorillibacterium sp. sgz500922 TaxID=3446694 RepID=UPI003F662997
MTIQFLDSRTSELSNTNTGTGILPVSPALLVGDIGLQVALVIGTPNEADVRIELWGTLGVSGTAADTVTITVERGGTATPGTGTVIYTASPGLSTGDNLLTFHAADFHPAIPASGQLRYTMFAAHTGGEPAVTITGPVAFSGIAQAGAI